MQCCTMRIAIALLCFANLLMIRQMASAQGALSQMKEDVRASSKDKSASGRKKRARSKSQARDCDDDSLGEILGELILLTAGAPFWMPPNMLNDDYASASDFA